MDWLSPLDIAGIVVIKDCGCAMIRTGCGIGAGIRLAASVLPVFPPCRMVKDVAGKWAEVVGIKQVPRQ